MPITIGSNIASLLAQRRLGESSSALASVFERLASGQRINRASDDAAGLAIADSLRANSRVYSQAIRNSNDGISLLSITDSGLGELSKISVRIAELAEQAANGTYNSNQRQVLDAEAQSLVAEYNRIVSSVQFNGINLLNGEQDSIDIQVGLDSSLTSRINIGLPSIVSTATPDGSFYATDTITQAGRSETIATLDINGDGNIDIVGTGSSGSGLQYAFGNGDGTFQDPVMLVPNNHSAIAVGDFNSDGRTDIIVSRSGVSTYFKSNGSSLVWSGVVGDTTRAVSPPLVADLNKDGALDLLVVDESSGNELYQTILGNGDGTFQAAQNTSLGADVDDAVYGDLNNDGNIDLFFKINSGQELVALGNGDGTFQSPSAIGSLNLDKIELGDINNDGKLDLVTAFGFGGVVSYLGNGNGTFGTATTVVSYKMTADLTLFDVNSDGNLDVVRSTSSGMFVFEGNGDGTFKAGVGHGNYSSRMQVLFDDFNNDGIFDAAIPGYDLNSIRILTAGSTKSADLSGISLLTQESALAALEDTRSLLTNLSSARASIGAYQGRLEAAVNNLYSTRDNSIYAESRIRDVDVAIETAELTKLQILQKISAAILAQANIQPQIGLNLIKS